MSVHCRKVATYDVYIGRPSRGKQWGFGNPFVIGIHGDRATVIDKFDKWLFAGMSFGVADATEERRQWILSNLESIRGKVLACWCAPGEACHGDILERLLGEKK